MLFASGAAMVIDAGVFDRAGGFDERYFMFFEDVDLGWRLWLLGYRGPLRPRLVRLPPAPRVDVDGRHPGASTTCSSATRCSRSTRTTTTRTCAPVLPAALTLTVGRGVARGGDDPHMLDLANASRRRAVDRVRAQGDARRPVRGRRVPRRSSTTSARRGVSSRRSADAADAEILPLFRQPFHPNSDLRSFGHRYAAVECPPSASKPASPARRRILVATGDTLQPRDGRARDPRLADRARAVARARRASWSAPRSARTCRTPTSGSGRCTATELAELVSWCDVVDLPGLPHVRAPVRCATSSKVVVADIYDPFHLEQLEQARDLGEADRRRRRARRRPTVLNEQLARGDFFLCASAQAARLLARPARRGRAASTRSPTTTTRASTRCSPSCRSA